MQKMLLICALCICSIAHAQIPELVKNVNKTPGQGSNIQAAFAYNNLLLFQADDGINGEEPWITNGTNGGTHLLKDINPTGSGFFVSPVLYNGKVYFAGNDGINGSQLWMTDGTDTGTHMVTALNSPNGSNPAMLTVCNSKLYMFLDDGVHGNQLWGTDGTSAGTAMVCNIAPGTGVTPPYPIVAFNGNLYFQKNGAFWVSDGTNAGTVKVVNKYTSIPLVRGDFITACNSKLFFRSYDAATGVELYALDGRATAYMVKDIVTVPGGGSNGHSFFSYKGELYFTTYYEGLWVSDGTDAGTKQVHDSIRITAIDDACMAIFNNKLYFSADDLITGPEPWCSDGTDTGTKLLKDLSPGIAGSAPMFWAAFNNKLYFIAGSDTNGAQLWVTDGTADSTKMILPVSTANNNALYRINWLMPVGDNLYFAANYDSAMGTELYRIGPPDTTNNITEIRSSLNNITAYPNPTKSSITIQYTLTQPGTPAYRLYDINGRCVASWLNETILSAGIQTKQLNMAGLPPATYQLQVEVNGSKLAVSVVKQ